jgi:hypothetical protein
MPKRAGRGRSARFETEALPYRKARTSDRGSVTTATEFIVSIPVRNADAAAVPRQGTAKKAGGTGAALAKPGRPAASPFAMLPRRMRVGTGGCEASG